MDLYITVSAKWNPEKKSKYGTLRPGWICKSSNPEIETERFETYDDAFESYIQLLKDNWSTTWENYPQVEISDPVARGKAERFTVDGSGEFTLNMYKDEVSVSWMVILTKPVNRMLSEFEPVEVTPKMMQIYDKIMAVSASTGMSPDSVLEKAQGELAAQKAGEEA